MSKEEFLRILGSALTGEVPDHIIHENIRYYDNYITGETAKGRSEEAVIEELGGPRIIARTIIDAAEAGGEASGFEGSGGADDGYSNASNTSYGSGGFGGSAYGGSENREDGYDPFGRGSQGMGGSFHMYDLSKWYWKLLGIAILVLVMFLLFTIVGGIFSLLLSPVGLILLLIILLWRRQR